MIILKILYQIYLILVFPLSLSICIIIRIISPFFLIRYACLVSTRIGHLIGNTEIYAMEKLKNANKKTYDFFYTRKKVCNKYALKILKQRIIILPFFIIEPIEKCNTFLEKFLKTNNKHEIGQAGEKIYVNKGSKASPVDKHIDFLQLNNVSFSYKESEKKIFKNLNYKFLKNNIYGLVGESGIGKTTLVNLICGFLKPNSGNIIFGDYDIDDDFDIFSHVGYIPQKVHILNSTLAENIAFGREEEDIDKEKIIDILKSLDMYEFYKSLNGGLQTKFGEKGIALSGGQAHRIGIARSLYQNSQIIIFDEPTSALDSKSEKDVLNLINRLKKNKIIIIISHRKSTEEMCDKVIDLQSI